MILQIMMSAFSRAGLAKQANRRALQLKPIRNERTNERIIAHAWRKI